MRIDVSCPYCDADFSVREQFAGMTVHCKKCKQPVDVPGRSEPLKRTSVSSGTTVASTRSRGPRKTTKRSGDGNGGMGMGLAIGGGAVAVIAVLIAVIATSGGGTPVPVAPPAPMAATPAAIAPVVAPTPVVATNEPAVPQPAPQTVAATETQREPAAVPVAKPKPKEEPPVDIPLPQLIARVEPAVIRLEVECEDGDSMGSGYIVHEDGTAVTNYHVITGAKAATALFADGTKVKVLGYKLVKPRADIAVIKLDLGDKQIEPIAVAASLPLKGIDVVGFGAPEGLSFTTSTGIISGIRNADVMAEETGQDLDGTWVQTTCPISSGSSGGPLTDRQGRVVAMNSMGHTVGQNLNFAISGVDISAAVTEAPPDVKPFIPQNLQEYERSIAKKDLQEEIGTPRGNALLAGLQEVTVVDPLAVFSGIIDPQQRIAPRIQLRARNAVEHRNVRVLTPGTKPGERFGLLLAFLDFEGEAKGRTGSQMLVAKSVMLCRDPEAKGRGGKFCVVWKGEEKLGSVSIPLLMRGQVPRNFQFEDKLLKLFNRLEASHRLASTGETKAEPAKEKAANSGPGGTTKKPVTTGGF